MNFNIHCRVPWRDLGAIILAGLYCVEVAGQEHSMSIPNDPSLAFCITFPCDGDILNRHDGEETPDGLTITVRGTAPEGAPVRVNGALARRADDTFSCPLRLTERSTRIVAEANGSSLEARVLWNRVSRKRYRFSVDDNIQFLKDLGTNPDRYPSLFDHWYLAFWREMHQTYGAKIHINIYYQTDGFDLTQMPDIWKEEWRANASWLHLSFHALQDKPDRPYRNASYMQMAHDYDLVCGHIRRFAGNEVLGNTTTIHWAECPRPAVLALRDRGIENLIGLFGTRHGHTKTCYYLTPEQSARCDARPAWHDHDAGITFIPCAVVVNAFSTDRIVEILHERAASPQTGELIELLIHEQYFRKELDLYQPDILDKVRVAIGWASENGYEPVFWSEGFLGAESGAVHSPQS